MLRTAGGLSAVGLAGCLDVLERHTDLRTEFTPRSQADFDPPILPYDETYPDDDGVAMFRGGLRRLGYYPDETVPDDVTVNWQLPVNYVGHTATKSSPLPTPDGETILIGSDRGRVHAVTPMGEHRWTAETGATRQGIHASPIVVDGVAYIGDYGGANRGMVGGMNAFDVETGDLLWRTTSMDNPVAIGSSAAYWDGLLYVVCEYRRSESGALYVLDAEDGRPLWSDHRIDGMPHPTVAIDPVHERILTGSNDGVCYCWTFPSLEFAWGFETGAEVKSPIATYDGAAFFGSWDYRVYRVDLETGEEDWSFRTRGVVMSAPGIDPEAGVVFVGSDDWRVYALDAASGEQVWSRDLGGRIMGALTVTADAVLVGTNAGDLYCLEKDTGWVRWRVENNGHVTSEPAIRDGRIYYTERAVVSGYYDEDEPTVTQVPGHAYCLVADE